MKLSLMVGLCLVFLLIPLHINSGSVAESKPHFNELASLQAYTTLAHPAVRVYNAIEVYSKTYNIPRGIAYRVAYKETGYKGPKHYDYNPYLTSTANAYGPCQIQLLTAKYVMNDDSITKDELLYNIELNIQISMKYLHQLHERYDNWETALGFYNTGYPIVNDYAQFCAK